MSLRKLDGGGAACAYCGFALVMEGDRQCCPAGRDYDALKRELEAQAREIEDLRARAVDRLVAYCVCADQSSPRDGCDCVCCTTARLESRLAAAESEIARYDAESRIRQERLAAAERERDELLKLRHQFAEENSRLFTERSALQRERDEARVEVAQLRELLNCYNLGGWTDAERLMRERDEAVALLREAHDHVPTTGYDDLDVRIDAFLAKLEAKP